MLKQYNKEFGNSYPRRSRLFFSNRQENNEFLDIPTMHPVLIKVDKVT